MHGESLKSSLIAIVSPDPDVLLKFAETELGLKGDMVELCNNEVSNDFLKESSCLVTFVFVGHKEDHLRRYDGRRKETRFTIIRTSQRHLFVSGTIHRGSRFVDADDEVETRGAQGFLQDRT